MTNHIILDHDCLFDDFLPPQINGREFEIRWLTSALFPAARGRKPAHVWVCGKPGSGKSCVSRYVLRKLKERWGETGGIYLNCAVHSSLYSILDAVSKEFRLLGAEAPSTAVKLEKFQSFLRNRPFIVILDELDFVPPKERNNILYNMTRNGNIGLICISQSDATYRGLDQRVRSRLNARLSEFKPYDPDRIAAILRDRAGMSLRPGSWNESVLGRLACLADGDARVAIEALKSSAEHSENEGHNAIRIQDQELSKEAKEIEVQRSLKRLTEHHRIIFRIVESRPGIDSTGLRTAYEDFCRNAGIQPIARRTFTGYLLNLQELSLVESERLPLKGKVRSFHIY